MSPSAKAPEHLDSFFERAHEIISGYYEKLRRTPEAGTITIGGERMILVRAAAMSVEFFDIVRSMYADEGEARAQAIAHGILFDVAHALGRADAAVAGEGIRPESVEAHLALGPTAFAHAGWARVEILDESDEQPDPNDFCLHYIHHNSFEADSWLKSKGGSSFPVCVMNAGYSSGWLSESAGIHVVSTEVLCRAKGDECCRFIMAPPDRIGPQVEAFLDDRPQLAERATTWRVPGFFERKEIEEALREKEAQYRSIFEASSDALLVVAESGQIAAANARASELFDLPNAELTGASCEALLDGEFDLQAALSGARSGHIYHIEANPELASGERKVVELRASALRFKREPHLLLSLRDITQHRQMQEQLYRADRLASLGQLAAGVAHEINNPLSFVISNLEFVSWEIAKEDGQLDTDDVREALARARRGTERVKRTVRDLTNFAHGGLDDSVDAVDVHRILDLAVLMVEKTVEHKGGYIVKNYGDAPEVIANESRLNQVFVNLLVNAVQALPDDAGAGGRIEIATGTDDQHRAVIRICDNGVGIPPHLRERIFDPFFTTKPVGEGTGIGLSICHEILQAIGGKIAVDSKVGEGTEFTVRLPTAEQLDALTS